MDKEIVEKISNIYKYNIKLLKTKNEIVKSELVCKFLGKFFMFN